MEGIKSYRNYFLKNPQSVYVTSQMENLFYNFYLITFILKFKIDNIIAENYNDNFGW